MGAARRAAQPVGHNHLARQNIAHGLFQTRGFILRQRAASVAVSDMQRINGQPVMGCRNARIQNRQTGQSACAGKTGKQTGMVLADNRYLRAIAQRIIMHFQSQQMPAIFHIGNQIGMAKLGLGRKAQPIGVGLAANIGFGFADAPILIQHLSKGGFGPVQPFAARCQCGAGIKPRRRLAIKLAQKLRLPAVKNARPDGLNIHLRQHE